MTLRLNGSSSGYVEIDAPAAAGSNTLTLPTGNGSSGQVLSTNGSGALSFVDRMTAAGPAFSAGGTTQTLSPLTDTKVVLTTEYFDTASCYDTGTSRFTPNVAGYYFISAEAQYIGATRGGLFTLQLRLTNTYRELAVHNGLDQYMRQNIQFLTYMNGTDDFIELYARQTDTSSRDIGSTYFQGFLARPA